MRPRVVVEIHRHGRDSVDDITSVVTKLEWARSLTSPWQSLTVTWKATVGDSISRVMEGDWIVLRIVSAAAGGKGVAAALCHVDSTSGGLSVGQMGEIYTEATTATCTSWWSLLSGVNLYSVYGWVEDIGTMLSMGTWANLIGSISSEYAVGSLGEAFKKLFKRLAAVELPKTLVGNRTGVTLGDVIPVVHNYGTGQQYAKTLTVESIDIGGGPPSRLSPMIGAYEATAVDILTGAFVPEGMLMELFPTFEPTVELQTSDAPPAAEQSIETQEYLKDFLGGWESLVLRMKPFRVRPLKESAVAWASYQHVEIEQVVFNSLKVAFPYASEDNLLRASQAITQSGTYDPAIDQAIAESQNTTGTVNAAASAISDRYFNEVTWNYTTAKYVPTEIIRSLNWQRSDRSRLNCSSISLAVDATNGVEGLAPAGLPITYDTEIRRHGLRLMKPQWSFTIPEIDNNGNSGSATGSPPRTNTSLTTDFVAYMRTICAQMMQFYKNNHLFMSGNIGLNLTEAVRSRDNSTVFDKILSIRPGEIIALSLDRKVDTFYAYVDTIQHSFEVKDGGIETARTSVAYSRGHFGVSDDALAKEVKVPLRPAQGAGSPSSRRSNRRNSGNSTTFPAAMILTDTSKLGWLKAWSITRGFQAKWFDPDFVPVPNMYDPGNTYKRSYVIAAVAYVIEKYWDATYPGAKIKATHGRATLNGDRSQNHTSGSAIDFSIKLRTVEPNIITQVKFVYPEAPVENGIIDVPVLQVWATLKRLYDAGRIPKGGKGLYLNLSEGGLRGTQWGQAGNTSSSGWPPGSSAGVHYDFRGTFGRIYKPLFNELTSELLPVGKYVRVDINNDGSDDYDETTPAQIASALFAVPGLTEYYNTEGVNDPTMPTVDSSVPNILQVLGLAEPVVEGP
jgi:hypothetical protein